jgi:hypothetical protein
MNSWMLWKLGPKNASQNSCAFQVANLMILTIAFCPLYLNLTILTFWLSDFLTFWPFQLSNYPTIQLSDSPTFQLFQLSNYLTIPTIPTSLTIWLSNYSDHSNYLMFQPSDHSNHLTIWSFQLSDTLPFQLSDFPTIPTFRLSTFWLFRLSDYPTILIIPAIPAIQLSYLSDYLTICFSNCLTFLLFRLSNYPTIQLFRLSNDLTIWPFQPLWISNCPTISQFQLSNHSSTSNWPTWPFQQFWLAYPTISIQISLTHSQLHWILSVKWHWIINTDQHNLSTAALNIECGISPSH